MVYLSTEISVYGTFFLAEMIKYNGIKMKWFIMRVFIFVSEVHTEV